MMNRVSVWVASRRRWTLTSRHAALAALVLAGPGLFYAAYKVVERGPLPVTDSARQDYVAERLPGYNALRWIEWGEPWSTVNEPPTVYGVHLENLRYYAPGRYLGEQMGPFRYALLGHAASRGQDALHAYLRALGVDYLLVPRHPPTLPKPDLSGSECFDRVFEDSSTWLFRVRESCSKGVV
jgi:hypothetical protein